MAPDRSDVLGMIAQLVERIRHDPDQQLDKSSVGFGFTSSCRKAIRNEEWVASAFYDGAGWQVHGATLEEVVYDLLKLLENPPSWDAD